MFPTFLPDLVYAAVARPAAYLQSQLLMVGNYGRALFQVGRLAADNRRWQDENAVLLVQLADTGRLERENQLLRDQLKINRRNESPLRLAKIFAINRGPLTSTLLIDQGETAGVRAGMAVVAGNILMGSVAEAYSHSALVWLVDDPRSQISVRAGPAVIGRTRGEANHKLALELVTNQETVSAGDLAVTSGLDRLPEGLLVGKVSAVGLTGGNLFQTIQLQPFFTQPLLPLVFVILK